MKIYNSLPFKIFVIFYFSFTIPYFIFNLNDYTETININNRMNEIDKDLIIPSSPCLNDFPYYKTPDLRYSEPKEIDL